MKAHLRRLGCLGASCRESQAALAPLIGTNFNVREATGSLLQSWVTDWAPFSGRMPPNGGWDWPEVRRNITSNPDQFVIAISHEQAALCGVALFRVARGAICVEAMEGSPAHHPLKGLIVQIVLDVAARFAQALGRSELKLIDPVDGLISRYEGFGFTVVQPKSGPRYCYRKV